ncbi:uncharacterized protein RHO25_005266 [Cercospora beticola]|uniref:Pentapeptide repeat-containing protein n=1 Tax=Cercospora beticola TaxID=122368 RepID=A0ABZ0NM70_CERBT|nr:hypothetical protein RHO25_005266 [Cercospora beticola]CAK1361125.1 unnamed protein product [Cercospora beticola]
MTADCMTTWRGSADSVLAGVANVTSAPRLGPPQLPRTGGLRNPAGKQTPPIPTSLPLLDNNNNVRRSNKLPSITMPSADATHMKDILGRLAGVNLRDSNPKDEDSGGAPIDFLTFKRSLTASASPSLAASSSGESSSDLSVQGNVYFTTARPSLVYIQSETSSEIGSPQENFSSASPLARSTEQVVPSDVPACLDVKFSPILHPPRYGLVIQNHGVDIGGGFINVTFVNCRFDPHQPTIFDNCSIRNTTFKNCDFREVALENVAMDGNTFTDCSFNCTWKNRKLAVNYPWTDETFKDISVHDDIAAEIVAMNKTRKEAEEAKIANPPPEERHRSGWGNIKGFESAANDSENYNFVEPIAMSNEPYRIPLALGKGLTFDNTPAAGLFITDGSGCRIENVQFIRCTFKNTTFDTCHLVIVIFQDCQFDNASFKEVVITDRTYQKAWFDGCDWKWRELQSNNAPISGTYRQGGLNGVRFPEIMLQWAKAQKKKAASRDRQALVIRPPTKYQKNKERRDISVKNAAEVMREQLGAGEMKKTLVQPRAVGRRKGDVGTTFVTVSFD